MNPTSSLLVTLSKSEMARTFERSFGDATGLPVAIVEKDDWQPALRGQRHENPFCALMVGRSKSCAACLQCQSSLRDGAMDGPGTRVCPYGLVEAAVPIKVGPQTAGHIVTGQVMRRQPTEAEFDDVAKRLDISSDLSAVRDAYFRTPIVPKCRFDAAVTLLAFFSEHISIKANQLAIRLSNGEPAVVTRAKHYLAEHIEDDLDLNEVAQAAGASSYYLCKLFRRHLGMTFTEYVSRCRVERAKEMLLKPTVRISEVAFEVGFQSLTHFNRVFRKVVGGSPTEYREHLPVAG